MHGTIGNFRIGEDIAVALDAIAGDTGLVSAITASMKPAMVVANRIVLDDAATGIVMTVTSQGASGWLVSLPAANTAALAAGIYGIDARLTLSGAVEMTEQSGFIALSQAAVA
jgi:hypothetical protein